MGYRLNPTPPVWRLIIVFFSILPSTAFSQQSALTMINGWHAYVHLPDDYNSSGTKKYPAIVFLAGASAVEASSAILLATGPAGYIAKGWDGNVTVKGAVVKPIIIALQPPAPWLQPAALDRQLESIKASYRIDPAQVNLTGLSMGSWAAEIYIQASKAYAGKIASVVAVQAIRPDEVPSYPAPFTTYAGNGSHWLGYEQDNDISDMQTIANTMNKKVPGSATYITTSATGTGGANTSDNCYDPAHTDTYSLNGITGNYSIYQFMLISSKAAGTTYIPPTVSAGTDQEITLPNTSVRLQGTVTAAEGTSISSHTWTQTSGALASIESDSLSTNISGLAAGTYTFTLTAKDNNGQTAASNVTVTVKTAAGSATPSHTDADASSAGKFTTWPNPARDVLTVNWTDAYQGKADIQIYDLTGKNVQTLPVMKEGSYFTDQVAISTLAPGVYVVKILQQNGRTLTQKFLKQ
jgi:hypothetical protein